MERSSPIIFATIEPAEVVKVSPNTTTLVIDLFFLKNLSNSLTKYPKNYPLYLGSLKIKSGCMLNSFANF